MRSLAPLALLFIAVNFTAHADVDISGGAGIEQRYFIQDALYPEQSRGQLSFYAEPEIYTDWNDGQDSLIFKPFLRVDQRDDERTHWDIRELAWLRAGDTWEIKAGISKVFWGQTESLHLVDVINQTDAVEAIDGEDKLGQPMVSLAIIRDWGTTSFFVLPYFRERTFASLDGRFRLPLDIDVDNVLYESDDQEKNVDFALRWQHSIGDWEVGLSYFDGTNREPDLILNTSKQQPSLTPFYSQMQQTGVDLLAIVDSWLLKFEGIHRSTEQQDFFAAVAGFEFTSVGVLDSVYDIGWLMEYQYDERDELSPTPAQNDVMLGSRIVFNDIAGTELLLGMVQDLERSSSRSGFIEASSRINDNFKWRLDAWLFSSDDMDDPVYFLRRDDYVQFAIEYYF